MTNKLAVQSYPANGKLEITSLRFLIGLFSGLPLIRWFTAQPYIQVVKNVLNPLSGSELKKLIRAYIARLFAAKYLKIKQSIVNIEHVARFVRCDVSSDFESDCRLKKPIIVLLWHSTMDKIRFSALHKLNLSSLMVARKRTPFSLKEITVAEDPTSNGILLKTLLEHLDNNGVLFIFMDGRAGASSIPINFFNRTIMLRRGPAVLARLSKAMVYPGMNLWDQETGEYQFRIGARFPLLEPNGLSSLQWEQSMLQTGASWFEEFFKDHPEEIAPWNFRKVINYGG